MTANQSYYSNMIYRRERIHDSTHPEAWRFPTTLMDCAPFKTARIKEAGYGLHDPMFYAERIANRGFYVVVISIKGSGRIIFEDESVQVIGPETVFISSPTGQGHREETLGNELWEHLWINVYPDSVLLKYEEFDHKCFKFTYGDMLSRIIRNLLFEAFYDDTLSNDAIENYEKLIILNLNRILDQSDTYEMREYRKKFTELWKTVSSMPQRVWNVEELCREVNYSRSQLTRICHLLYNMSPGRKVREIKMDHAVLLLRHSQLSIGAISEAIGYTDIYTFSSAFSRHFGKSPSSMRRNPYNGD